MILAVSYAVSYAKSSDFNLPAKGRLTGVPSFIFLE
jgi:hypothetical protein